MAWSQKGDKQLYEWVMALFTDAYLHHLASMNKIYDIFYAFSGTSKNGHPRRPIICPRQHLLCGSVPSRGHHWGHAYGVCPWDPGSRPSPTVQRHWSGCHTDASSAVHQSAYTSERRAQVGQRTTPEIHMQWVSCSYVSNWYFNSLKPV